MPDFQSEHRIYQDRLATAELPNHFEAVRSDLLRSGMVSEVALSNSSVTGVNYGSVEMPVADLCPLLLPHANVKNILPSPVPRDCFLMIVIPIK